MTNVIIQVNNVFNPAWCWYLPSPCWCINTAQGLEYSKATHEKWLNLFQSDDVAYWKMTTLKAALPDWFGQKNLTVCLKYKNGMELT